jgi:hypothetical protein
VARYPRIAFILTSAAFAQPADLVRRVAENEAAAEAARGHYTYRQTVEIHDFDPRTRKTGVYRETRDVIFSPAGERTERFLSRPVMALNLLRLTDEDFRDIREVQPFLITPDRLRLYTIRYRGDEKVDGVDCWVLDVRPRQTLDGQRLFEGLFWVDRRDYSILRSEGRAVPQIVNLRSENLFPAFTTFREKVGGHSFPVHTHADDTLHFSTGPIRIRMTIKYSDYMRFAAESTITFK